MKILLDGFSTLGWAINIFKEILLFLDSLVFGFAADVLKGFFDIVNISSEIAIEIPQVDFIMKRIMILAGIYALFRISLMLINYLIHPEKYTELSKSSYSIVSSVIIAIVLLVSSGFIFEQLGKFQSLFFSNEIIPKIIYGPNNAKETNNIKTQSKQFVNRVFLIFYEPRTGVDCQENPTGDCIGYNRVYNGSDRSIYSLLDASSSSFDYTPGISFIVGCLLIFYFIKFSISIGVRIFKLIVLQVISPIPIIMSVDPSRKNQLATYAKTYFAVYLQVFIRVFTFYLAFVALDILKALPDQMATGTSSTMLLAGSLFVNVILIIAVFQAAQELPKLIEEALNIKLGLVDGGKGFGGVVKGIIGGAAGFVGGAVAGGLAGGAGGAFAGAATGLYGGAMGAAGSKNAAAGVSATVAAVGKSHKLGGNIRGSGGLMPFMIGGAENKILGGTQKDAATIKSYDDKIKGFDDKIKGFDDDIKVKNDEIGGINSQINTRRQSDSLRDNIDQTVGRIFDQNHGSLQERLSGDFQYNNLSEKLKSATTEEDYNRLFAQRESRKQELTRTYDSERKTFFEGQVGLASGRFTGSTPNEEIAQAVKDYNNYVEAHGMADRKIQSSADSERAANLSKKDVEAYNKAIEQREADKKQIESNKISEEANKKAEEDRKKAFMESPEYQRRNKRQEDPKYKPRS